VFDRWYNGGDPRTSVRDFDAILAVYVGQEAPMCCYQPQCGSYVVVEYNGDVYPCDFFVREDLRLGNITETPLEKLFGGRIAALCPGQGRSAARMPGLRLVPALPAGLSPLCGAGGKAGTQSAGAHYLCRAYQRFFSHSQAGFMALRDRVLAQRGALTQGMALTPAPLQYWERGERACHAGGLRRHTWSRGDGATPRVPVRPVGRNDPCPCGSGRKYKQCCGRKGAGA